MEKYNHYRPGILVSIVLAGIAISVEKQYPLLWSVLGGLMLGILLKNIYKIEESWLPGLNLIGQTLFKYGFAILGFTVNLQEIGQISGKIVKLIIVIGMLVIQIQQKQQTRMALAKQTQRNVFIFGGIFLLGVMINSLSLIPPFGLVFAESLSRWLLAIAAVGIGVNLSLKEEVK